MLLKKKIALSFLVSSSVIVILIIFEFINFFEIRKEIRHLEITDTIRSESLQLRRHEKNFFLYPSKAEEETIIIQQYITELSAFIDKFLTKEKAEPLKNLIGEYKQRFEKINHLIKDLSKEMEKKKAAFPHYSNIFPLIDWTFHEQPLQGAKFLEKTLSFSPDDKIILGLNELDAEILLLRKNGEEILGISKNLDRAARDKTEQVIHISQVVVGIFLPLFFMSGLIIIFLLSKNVVNRLRLLIDIVEKIGKGDYPKITIHAKKRGGDEMDILILKFIDMEEQLMKREKELNIKNIELLQSKKLAAIGTLASGVAHEMNNPLNNIYISTQMLLREIKNNAQADISGYISDIHKQTLRVKNIVGNLLEFARGKDPHLKEMDLEELNDLIISTYNLIGRSVDLQNIKFQLNKVSDKVMVYVDRNQLEQVFLNLFVNAVEAMSGKGNLEVNIDMSGSQAIIKVSDNGRGIAKENLEKVFEPFFSSKDKGTGLGLAIVYNIIKKHHGEISCESEEGKGTSFKITLPTDRKIP
jgi:two-component system, NtrC family, sensor kinase